MRQKNVWLVHVVLIALSAIFVIPLLWMISTSLKTIGQTTVLPPVWIPHPVKWHNYSEAVMYGSDKLHYIPFLIYGRNTLLISLLAVAGTVCSNSLVAYAFARMKWPGRDLFFAVTLAVLDGSVSGDYGSDLRDCFAI